LLADCWQLCEECRAGYEQRASSAKQSQGPLGDEVGALLRHPVTAAPYELEGEVVAVSLDTFKDRRRDVEVVGAEQQPGRARPASQRWTTVARPGASCSVITIPFTAPPRLPSWS
jgi:hypothetical protein